MRIRIPSNGNAKTRAQNVQTYHGTPATPKHVGVHLCTNTNETIAAVHNRNCRCHSLFDSYSCDYCTTQEATASFARECNCKYIAIETNSTQKSTCINSEKQANNTASREKWQTGRERERENQIKTKQIKRKKKKKKRRKKNQLTF